MTSVLAPVLPHLAEEIHAQCTNDPRLSFFMQKWIPLVRYMISYLQIRVTNTETEHRMG